MFLEKIKKLEGFRIEGTLEASELIIKDNWKVDFFFGLSTEFRIHYIRKLVGDSHVC